jgi:hypothetical protein
VVSTNFSAVDLQDTDTGHTNGARGHDALNAAIDIATRPASTRAITHSVAGALSIDVDQLLGGHIALVTVSANITALTITNMTEGLPFQLILKGNGVSSFTANLSSIKVTNLIALDAAVAVGPTSYISVVFLKISDGTLWAPGGLLSYGAVGSGSGITAIANSSFLYAGSFVTSFNITLPTGISTGNLIEIIPCHQDAGITGAFTISGYTQRFHDGANNVKMTKLYKIASGSESGATVSITCPGSVRPYAGAQVWSGVHQSDPYDVNTVPAAVSGGNNPDPASITPDNTDAMAVVYAAGNRTPAGAATPPSGYTKSVDQAASNDRALVIARKLLTAASAENPGTFTWTLDSSIVFTDVLRKA